MSIFRINNNNTCCIHYTDNYTKEYNTVVIEDCKDKVCVPIELLTSFVDEIRKKEYDNDTLNKQYYGDNYAQEKNPYSDWGFNSSADTSGLCKPDMFCTSKPPIIWDAPKGQKITNFTGIGRYNFTEYENGMMDIYDCETANKIWIPCSIMKYYSIMKESTDKDIKPKLEKEDKPKYSRIQIICPTHIFKSERSVLKIMNEIFNPDYKDGKRPRHVISCGKHNNNVVCCYYKKSISISFMVDDTDFINKIHKFISI